MAARKRPAATRCSVRGRALFCRPPLAVGGLFEAAHAAEVEIKRKDAAYRFGFGGINDQLALMHVVTERRVAAHPHAFLFGGGDLVPDPLASQFPFELREG